MKFYAELFDFATVPVLPLCKSLQDMYDDNTNENEILETWLFENLGMTWTESVETPGRLGGYSPETGKDCSEGFVIRNQHSFHTNDGTLPVAENEFNNVFKLVRKSHVQTDIHWTKTWKPARLIEYSKYKWFGYEYLEKT